jgi:hypothetical protein
MCHFFLILASAPCKAFIVSQKKQKRKERKITFLILGCHLFFWIGQW